VTNTCERCRELEAEIQSLRSKLEQPRLSRSVSQYRAQKLRQAQRDAALADKAANRNHPWTAAELNLVSNDALTIAQVAAQLNRTYNGVRKMRARLRAGGPPDWLSDKAKKASSRSAARMNSESLETATRWGYPWTGPELELLARTDLTARQIATMTGRSCRAVYGKRHQLKADPKTINHAGLGTTQRQSLLSRPTRRRSILRGI
jgi:hypothetical protein